MSAHEKRSLISFCIPVFNEEENIPNLISRLQAVTGDLAEKYDFEFLFTDNCSTDKTFELLSAMAVEEPRIRVLRLSRNFGFQRSILANYLNASGDALMQLDADLQDPPELVAEFLALWELGYKVVYGIRRRRKEGAVITALRKIGYKVISFLSDEPVPVDVGDFRLIDRALVEALREYRDHAPYLRGLIATLGFRQIGVEYDREARQAGQSKFGLRALLGFGLDGLFATSMAPLRLATWAGVGAMIVSALGVAYYVYLKFTRPELATGMVSIHIIVLASIGFNALLLGIFGEYVGRIYTNTRAGPIVVIDETVGGRRDARTGNGEERDESEIS